MRTIEEMKQAYKNRKSERQILKYSHVEKEKREKKERKDETRNIKYSFHQRNFTFPNGN